MTDLSVCWRCQTIDLSWARMRNGLWEKFQGPFSTDLRRQSFGDIRWYFRCRVIHLFMSLKQTAALMSMMNVSQSSTIYFHWIVSVDRHSIFDDTRQLLFNYYFKMFFHSLVLVWYHSLRLVPLQLDDDSHPRFFPGQVTNSISTLRGSNRTWIITRGERNGWDGTDDLDKALTSGIELETAFFLDKMSTNGYVHKGRWVCHQPLLFASLQG
jgi:hypothetical protein